MQSSRRPATQWCLSLRWVISVWSITICRERNGYFWQNVKELLDSFCLVIVQQQRSSKGFQRFSVFQNWCKVMKNDRNVLQEKTEINQEKDTEKGVATPIPFVYLFCSQNMRPHIMCCRATTIKGALWSLISTNAQHTATWLTKSSIELQIQKLPFSVLC